MSHPAWIEVDSAALVHNARVLRRAIPVGTRLGLMVKANGYGHGAEIAARAAISGGADLLMVATLDEGLELRRAGIDAPMLVVYPILAEAVEEAAMAGLQLSVASAGTSRDLLAAWRATGLADRGHVLEVHAEVDTGMGRGGVAPGHLPVAVRAIDETPGTHLASIWSHLADGSDPDVSADQVRAYDEALASVAATGRGLPLRHVVATEGVFVATAPAYDMVRIGLGFYGELGVGVEASPEMQALAADLRPAMTVKARAIRLEWIDEGTPVGYGQEWRAERRSLIATLPIGYADGWTRQYWPGAQALVRGRRVPLVGRVSMDSICADVTDVAATGHDDEFVLLGSQGEERITAVELATLRGSIPNEVFCAFGPRLSRVEAAAAARP
jgi:alanine racemase